MMHRRNLIRAMAATGAAIALPGGLWKDLASALAAPAVPGVGPYGPLQAPDALGIRLPRGFTARLVATTGVFVEGTAHPWHGAPDGGGCVPTDDGGWIYLSNAELTDARGGVSAMRFDPSGNITDAYSVLSGTSRNCAGGVTPWNTWLSCEEAGANGEVFECDPYRPSQGIVRPAMGHFNHEAAAVDPASGDVYLTEDDPQGRLYRYVPDTPGDLSSGQLFAAAVADGLVSWVPTSADVPDRSPATTPFDGGEGIYHGDGVIWFATKGDNRVWELALATQELSVAYDCNAHPDGDLTDVDNVVVHGASQRVFVAEDAGNMELGVLSGEPGARTMSIFLRIDGHPGSELAGMAFSPDGTRMYLSSQRGTDGATGMTYEVTGPFGATVEPPDPPAEITVTAERMGWVRGGTYADQVMGGGANQQICLNSTENYSRRTFVAFPTSDAASFERATLTFAARVWRGTGQLVVEPVDPVWDPAALTWNRQPAVSGDVLATADLTADRSTVTVDVTDHLNALAEAGVRSASFRIRQTTRNGPLGYIDGPDRPDEPRLLLVSGDRPPEPPPETVTTTVPILADSWVRGGSFADTNNADSRLLQVCNNGNEQYARLAVLGADLDAIGTEVSRATLRLNARLSSGADVAHDVAVVDDGWSDTGLTWRNRPASDGPAVATFRIADFRPAWYELDVTAAVADARSRGATKISFVVRQVDRNGPLAYVNPSNHWTTDRPDLVIDHA